VPNGLRKLDRIRDIRDRETGGQHKIPFRFKSVEKKGPGFHFREKKRRADPGVTGEGGVAKTVRLLLLDTKKKSV